MTRFWRDGHIRIGPYGDEHWVEGHWVERDAWNRAGNSRSWDFLSGYSADKGMTSAYLVPNATCPVCGDRVFFYGNEHGSRVYFDELGPPWPKHPCMDEPETRRRRVKSDAPMPAIRTASEASVIDLHRRAVGMALFAGRYFGLYGGDYYFPWVILRRFKVREGVLIAAMNLKDRQKRSFFLLKSAKASLKRGAIVFPRKGKISFLDPASLQVAELPYKRVGSKDFMHKLLDPEGLEAEGN